jgi:hypothetical protein
VKPHAGHNQQEENNWDQAPWRHYRQQLTQTLTDRCRAAGLAVAGQWYEIPYHHAPRIVTMLFWDMLPAQAHWIDLNRDLAQKGQTVTVVSDNFVSWPDLSHVRFRPCTEILGMAANYQDRSGEIKQPARLFSCFMQRADSVRQSWLYFLHHRGLIDQGYVSYLLLQKGRGMELTGQGVFDQIHRDHELGTIPHFESAYQSLRARVPFRNFDRDRDLVDLLIDSEFSICLETYATYDDFGAWCWTEKSLRDLQLSVSPLLFMQKHAGRKLADLGLDVPEYVLALDHLPWIQRQTSILDLLTQGSLETRQRAQQRALHNSAVLTAWLDTALDPDYFADIVQEARDS